MTCGSLSRARRGNERGAPKALRGEDARTLWGLPGLTGLDAICLRAANQLIRFVCRVADKCFAHDVCVIMSRAHSRVDYGSFHVFRDCGSDTLVRDLGLIFVSLV